MAFGRSDVAVPAHRLVVECGDTSCRKAVAALTAEFEVAIVPFICCAPAAVCFRCSTDRDRRAWLSAVDRAWDAGGIDELRPVRTVR